MRVTIHRLLHLSSISSLRLQLGIISLGLFPFSISNFSWAMGSVGNNNIHWNGAWAFTSQNGVMLSTFLTTLGKVLLKLPMTPVVTYSLRGLSYLYQASLGSLALSYTQWYPFSAYPLWAAHCERELPSCLSPLLGPLRILLWQRLSLCLVEWTSA